MKQVKQEAKASKPMFLKSVVKPVEKRVEMANMGWGHTPKMCRWWLFGS